MNKRSNPFYGKTQPTYAAPQPSQPPLPPGQPPAQQPAYDYSAYWAAAVQAAQQPFAQAGATPAAYANYGYGPAWQQPQQAAHRQANPPPPPTQPPPAPVQYPYPAPAPPQPQAPPPPAPVAYPTPAPPTHAYPQYSTPPAGQPPPSVSVPRPPQPGRNPPPPGYNSGPPAKRGRFDGPPRGGGRPSGGPQQFRNSNQSYNNGPPPVPSPTHQGVNQAPLGQPPPDNGGAYSRGGSRGMGRGRGQPLRGARGRGSAMLGGRPPMSGTRGGAGRGNASLRGGRGGSYSSASRPDRVPFQAPQSHNGWGRGPVGAPAAPASVAGGPQEGKRTLTDFRITGFGFTIPEESIIWSWGGVRGIEGKDVFGPVDVAMKSDNGKDDGLDDASDGKPKKPGKETARIRIYFQPSVVTAGSTARASAMGPPPVVPPRQSAKRKKSDSDDESERTNAKRHHPDGPRSASLDAMSAPNESKAESLPAAKAEDAATALSEAPIAEENGVPAPSVTQGSDESSDWLVDTLDQADEDDEADGDEEHYDEHEGYEHEGDGDEEIDSLFGSARASPPNGNGPELIINPVDESATEDRDGESAAGQQDAGKRENAASTINRNKRPRDDDSASINQAAMGGQSGAGGPGKGNKLSISYATSSRRLVFEADVIEYFKVYRSEGRIEFMARVGSAAEGTGLQGISLDVLNEATQQFQTVTMPSTALPNVSDTTLPLLSVTTPRKVIFHVFLDLENPLSVPRWVKTGDVDDWLQSMFGPSNRGLRAKDRGWEGKISVVDPDPAPTIQTIFENWATNSLAAQQKDREQFLRHVMGEDKGKDHDMDGVMEILLRMVRGRDQHHQDGSTFQPSHHHHNFNVSNALFQAASPGPAIAQHQTAASLAVLALFRALQDFGVRFGGEEGKREANERAKTVLRMMPQNTLFRSLDGMFREWYSEKRGHR